MKISILGSCVTRDAFPGKSDPTFELGQYIARSSLASLCSAAPPQIFPTHTITSSFQRRMVEFDLTKQGVTRLIQSDPDALIYDPIDERFHLWAWPDKSIATLSVEFHSMKPPARSSRLRIPEIEEASPKFRWLEHRN
ncbi:DUF6270 domain-containing protein [Propioniferax innocua]|uniref:DUF6270 domain-containing protein n=1 Tax=Propioniferax innocua TaxID=1753 RepID=UPI0011543B47|nr:DUF6270 domain-containing protein [Propioniferax innocua]